MRRDLCLLCGLALVIAASAAAQARDIEMGGDGNYPYSIMVPEPGSGHHRGTAAVRSQHIKSPSTEKPLAARPSRTSAYAMRGSAGVVLPTPLPKTQLIPPEGGSAPIIHTGPQEQGPTVLPGLNPIPNLPHGTETFQDRASRCAQQQGLYGVPATATGIYMHTCAM
ncbi:MAG TPA: hypothetical protein VK749_19945 [Xanthobacteraceae bacterium]|nr:hypothetical protein [Xanthobacteraceae bacterium]